MPERFFQHILPNGLVLLAEKMNGVQSAAMNLLIPAGASTDPADGSGSATVLSDLIFRGAGGRDSRQLSDHLDSLGLQRGGSVGVHHTRLSARGIGRRIIEALPAYADIVQRPHLSREEFEPARDLAIQAIEGLDDDPRQKLMLKLNERHLPIPYGRSAMGRLEDLQAMTAERCRGDQQRRYRPGGAILAVAGNIDFDALCGEVERHFAGWAPGEEQAVELRPPPGPIYHEPQSSEQTHIGLAWPSVPETHEDYYVMRLAIECLSGGMSGRLFTEIREKRGLVYNVWAGYFSLKGYGAVFGYAGTSNERAQATLDTFIAELRRLSEGVTESELDRAKVGLKSATIMQGESSGARAGAIAHDYFMRGRIRTLDEIKAAIDAVTLDRVNDWLRRNPSGPFTIVTVGPRELKVPS